MHNWFKFCWVGRLLLFLLPIYIYYMKKWNKIKTLQLKLPWNIYYIAIYVIKKFQILELYVKYISCHSLLIMLIIIYKWSEVAQSCLTLCDPKDCSLPGFSIHGIFQVKILEWVAISFSRGSSRLRDWTQVSRIAGRRLTLWATREANNL